MSQPALARCADGLSVFVNESFWNYREGRAPSWAQKCTIPLGLITVAAMLPRQWNVRLVNLNTEELTDTDLEWADLVMTGGMMFSTEASLNLADDTELITMLKNANFFAIFMGIESPR